MAFRKTEHPGVVVYRRGDLGLYAKWRDPHTRQMLYVSLSTLGFRTKKQAASWLRQKAAELQADRRMVAREGAKLRLGDSLTQIEDEYIEHFAADHGQDSAERTRKSWLVQWRNHVTRLGLESGADVTMQHLAQFRDTLASVSLKFAPATRNRHLGAVRAMLNWARRNGRLKLSSDNIIDAMPLFKVDVVQPRILIHAELVRLIDALVEHDTARYLASRGKKSAYNTRPRKPRGGRRFEPLGTFAIIALLSGARPGEVLSMRWSAVDLDRREVRVWGAKTRRERVVPMHDSPLLLEILRALHQKRGRGIHVCGDWARGQPREFHDRQWRRVTQLADLDRAPMKVLRATCIAHVASASPEPEYLLQSRFGHGTAVSKRHYRQPLHGLGARGETVESWLGIEAELTTAAQKLGLLPRNSQTALPVAGPRR